PVPPVGWTADTASCERWSADWRFHGSLPASAAVPAVHDLPGCGPEEFSAAPARPAPPLLSPRTVSITAPDSAGAAIERVKRRRPISPASAHRHRAAGTIRLHSPTAGPADGQ